MVGMPHAALIGACQDIYTSHDAALFDEATRLLS